MNRVMVLAAMAAVMAGCSWVPCGKPDAEATSPDGRNRIALVREGGALKITSYRRGVPTVTATFAGLDYLGSDRGPDPARDGIVGVTANATSGVRKTPVYKRAEISLASNRTVVRFARDWGVELAARNDGVAWRLLTFGDPKERVEIAAERTDFAFPDEDCWTWPGYGRKGKYDRFQWGFQPANAKVRARDVRVDDGTCETIQCLPLMSENPATGKWATLAESDIRDYPSMQLVRPSADAATVRAVFAAYPAKTEYTGRYYRVLEREKFIAKTSAARAFPWRVTLLGDTAGELTDSDCVAALAPGPDEGADFSWVKPGTVAWDWWNDWNLKGVGFKPGIDTRTYKYYIDFASRHGIPYVILDEGWSEKLDVTKVQKDIDLPELIRYGRARGVEIILWCAWAQLPGRQDEIFSKYAKMGVRGFKIDFMNRDDQEVVNFLEETARIAAKYRFHVDYHGMFKPYGLEQRYPNILSYEGVHGLEELKWVKHRDMPVIDCQHYFLRMSAGPMDYTPGAMLNRTREGWEAVYGAPCSQGTRCHQVALLPLYFSPLQMMADSPTNYEANEECARFMAGVPTAWDESRTLGGRPGEWAAVARRKGDAWWIGAINAWEEREVELDLSFLGAGEWTAETFADAPDAASEPEHYVRRTDVKVGRTLKVRMAPGGGFAAKIANGAKRSARRPLRVVYFTPSDCEPCPDRAERLCRVMKYVQDFYRRGMMRNGYGLQTFALEETVPGRLKLYEVRGKLKQAEYDRKSFGKVKDEVSAALKAEGLDVSKERMIVFQRGLRWEGEGKAIEVSSYVGSWNPTWGMCTVYDDPLLDPDNFTSTAPGGSYCGKPCSVGMFNSHYIGGVAHELGHALTLPHDGQTKEERQTLGRSLMGSGNHSFGQEHRGEGPGTFLTATDALRLSSVSTFNGGEPVSRTNDVTLLSFASVRKDGGRLHVKGQVAAGRPVKGLLVYVDPDEPKTDYDSQTWTVKPGADGSFDAVLTGVPTAPSALRVWAVRDCDSVKVHTARLDPLAGSVQTAIPAENATFANPVIARDWPDPTVWSDGAGGYCSVATHLDTLMRSPDLMSWTDTKTSPITPEARAALEKVSRNIWAPCVVKVGKVWNLYVSLYVSDANCKIAVLTASSPTGPFEFRGIVIDSVREKVLNAIDPYVFAADGKVLMFFGSLADGVHVVELTADGLSIAAGAKPRHVAGIRRPASKAKGAYEGAYVMKRGKWWYLFVSGGHYGNHTYYLTVGRSAAVTGPYLDREGNPLTEGRAKPILASGKDDHFYGPGHNGDVFSGTDGRTYMFYHAHCKANPRRERPMLLQELKWTDDDWPYFTDGRPQAEERRFHAVRLACKADRKSPAEPVRLIIDTDMYTDIDSGAVAIAHVLADAGECELIGVISCAGGSAVSVPMIELVNAVYGRPELPVGAPKDWVIAPEKDPERKGLDAHPERFPHYEQMRRAIRANPGLVRHARSDEAPDAVAVYRRLLAAQPDASVTICTIGWLTNMRQLLASRPDEISPLSGRDLVARKVRLLFSMACAFPDGREYNAWRDTISTAIVLYDWPGPIHFVDYNYGFGMKCGMPLARRPPSMNNPVQEIYRDTIQRNVCGKKGGHPAWDEVTVLFAVRGWEPYCHGVRGRFDIVNNRGDNRWTPDPNGPHVVVREKMPRKEVCAIIDELLTRAPKRGLVAAEAAK